MDVQHRIVECCAVEPVDPADLDRFYLGRVITCNDRQVVGPRDPPRGSDRDGIPAARIGRCPDCDCGALARDHRDLCGRIRLCHRTARDRHGDVRRHHIEPQSLGFRCLRLASLLLP